MLTESAEHKGHLQLPKQRTLQFVPLLPPLVQACEEFNERIRLGGVAGEYFSPTPNRDRGEDPPAAMESERFVGVDADGQIHSAYILRWQFLWLRGEQFLGACYGHPVSEGIVQKRYAMLGVSILRDAQKRCEFLHMLGASGREGSVFRVANHAGWQLADIPFLFRVIRSGRFVRNLPRLQRSRGLRLMAKVGADTGLARLGIVLLQMGRGALSRRGPSLRLRKHVAVEQVASLSDFADETWARARAQYDFCVVRDSAHVDPSFPLTHTGLHRLVVRHRGAVVGWAVVMTEGLERLRAYLGDVLPGLIVDAFGDVAFAEDIVRAATIYLASLGADVVVTNTSHSRWLAGYKRAGFMSWRSQFPLLVSKALARRIGNLAGAMRQSHFSRGDGDGVHYLH